MFEGYDAKAARESVFGQMRKDARFHKMNDGELKETIERMQQGDIAYVEGEQQDEYYDDEDAFEYILNMLCDPAAVSDGDEMFFCELVDGYLNAHQDYLDQAGLLDWD